MPEADAKPQPFTNYTGPRFGTPEEREQSLAYERQRADEAWREVRRLRAQVNAAKALLPEWDAVTSPQQAGIRWCAEALRKALGEPSR